MTALRLGSHFSSMFRSTNTNTTQQRGTPIYSCFVIIVAIISSTGYYFFLRILLALLSFLVRDVLYVYTSIVVPTFSHMQISLPLFHSSLFITCSGTERMSFFGRKKERNVGNFVFFLITVFFPIPSTSPSSPLSWAPFPYSSSLSRFNRFFLHSLYTHDVH